MPRPAIAAAGGSTVATRAAGMSTFVLAAAIALQVVLRIAYALHHSTDSDEPQHLHVVWGWTQGLVQYRDVFDNHAPLFHLALAPWLALVGERADIVIDARFAMMPLVLVTLLATYALGASLWTPRVGRWAAAFAGLAPSFLMTSTEFRADDLWMALWLLALVVLLGGRPTPRRTFGAGLLLGATLATSVKSVLLLLALGLAGAIVLGCDARARAALRPRLGRLAAAAAGGVLLVPAALILAFWRLHALGAMTYCTIEHNVVPGLGLWHRQPARPLVLPVALAAAVAAAAVLLRPPAGSERRRRVLVALIAALYLTLLETCWPLITREDFLPWTPLAVLVATVAARTVLAWTRRWWAGARRGWVPVAIGALVVAAEATALVNGESPWRDHTGEERRLLQQVLQYTRPGEPILDLKGETVFRPRPYYYVLEGVTKTRLAMHLLPDRIADTVVATRTHFALGDHPGFPPAARRFLNDHFVAAGALRVLGADLGPAWAPDPARPQGFEISYPDRFAVIAGSAPGRGLLDGRRVGGSVWLRPGSHVYVRAPGENLVTVIWIGALRLSARAPAASAL